MPSCHSALDLELAVQDLWDHLPQDNIRCLINSMPDRVAACFAAGVPEPMSPSQYGGYDPRLVTELVRVRTPSKTWLYLLRERSRSFAGNGFPS
ncbi:hypothetical protein TNCV_3482121 [Trichonephila clavipes]|nr:hypothetical protein TNCV_3482121 [Trichonephila clavipes]